MARFVCDSGRLADYQIVQRGPNPGSRQSSKERARPNKGRAPELRKNKGRSKERLETRRAQKLDPASSTWDNLIGASGHGKTWNQKVSGVTLPGQAPGLPTSLFMYYTCNLTSAALLANGFVCLASARGSGPWDFPFDSQRFAGTGIAQNRSPPPGGEQQARA
jgi:hypothetical protein